MAVSRLEKRLAKIYDDAFDGTDLDRTTTDGAAHYAGLVAVYEKGISDEKRRVRKESKS